MSENRQDTTRVSALLRGVAQLNGVLLFIAIAVSQFFAMLAVAHVSGPQASYDSLVLGLACGFWLGIPAGTIVGVVLCRRALSTDDLSRKLLYLWLIQFGIILLLIGAAFWLAHGKPWATHS